MKLFLKILILLIGNTIEASVVLHNDFAKLVSCDKSFINITLFKFYKKSRTSAALDVTYTTLEDIVSDDQLKLTVAALQFRGTEYKKTVIDFTIGICSLYKANKFDTLNIMKDSNVTGCPYPKGPYYIYNISPTSDLLPPFFPEGKWLLDLTFINYRKIVARVHWMLSVAKEI